MRHRDQSFCEDLTDIMLSVNGLFTNQSSSAHAPNTITCVAFLTAVGGGIASALSFVHTRAILYFTFLLRHMVQKLIVPDNHCETVTGNFYTMLQYF